MRTKILKYSIITAILGVALWSCNKSNVLSKTDQPITGLELKSIHDEIIQNISDKSSTPKSITEEYNFEEYEGSILKNMTFIKKNGVNSLLDADYLTENLIDFYREHENENNVYELLLQEYSFKNEKEVRDFFLLYEITKYIYNENLTEAFSWGCAFSIAASIIHTASAVTITTPLGLGFWLAGKVIATTGIIGGC